MCLDGFVAGRIYSGQMKYIPDKIRAPDGIRPSAAFRTPSVMAVKSLGFTSDKIRPFPDAVRNDRGNPRFPVGLLRILSGRPDLVRLVRILSDLNVHLRKTASFQGAL